MSAKILLCLTALAALVGCTTPPAPRVDVTYEEAAANRFVATNRDAINKLVAGFDLGPLGDTHPQRYCASADRRTA